MITADVKILIKSSLLERVLGSSYMEWVCNFMRDAKLI